MMGDVARAISIRLMIPLLMVILLQWTHTRSGIPIVVTLEAAEKNTMVAAAVLSINSSGTAPLKVNALRWAGSYSNSNLKQLMRIRGYEE